MAFVRSPDLDFSSGVLPNAIPTSGIYTLPTTPIFSTSVHVFVRQPDPETTSTPGTGDSTYAYPVGG